MLEFHRSVCCLSLRWQQMVNRHLPLGPSSSPTLASTHQRSTTFRPPSSPNHPSRHRSPKTTQMLCTSNTSPAQPWNYTTNAPEGECSTILRSNKMKRNEEEPIQCDSKGVFVLATGGINSGGGRAGGGGGVYGGGEDITPTKYKGGR